MNHNASTVDYIIFRIFIQTPTNENSASALSQLVNGDGCVPTVTGWLFPAHPRDTGPVQSWPAREHPTGSFGDTRGRRRPRKSSAGRVAPDGGSSARTSSGPALDAGRPTSNYFQDKCPCTVSKVWCPRPLHTSWRLYVAGVAVAAVRHDVSLQLPRLLVWDASSWHAISQCSQLIWHPILIPFAPAGSWQATCSDIDALFSSRQLA